MFGIDRDLLNYHIRKANLTNDAIASELGIDRTTWFRHLREGSMTVAEMHEVIKLLGLSLEEAISVFLRPVGCGNATKAVPEGV